MLYLIGLGLDCKDISLNALEAIKKCKKLYLEYYTNIGCSLNELEKLINKKVVLANRELIENHASKILDEAKKANIAILVYGDPLIATTHINYLIDARKANIKTKVIHAASIINAITETGLSIYNFGKTTSIPFNNDNITTPINVIKDNLKSGMHTLILLDLDPENNKFLTINQALKYLIKHDLDLNLLACTNLGIEKAKIRYGKAPDLIKFKFDNLGCLIIPGKLHFREKEALELVGIKNDRR